MNLHGIVSGAIGAVNPFVYATFMCSTGYSTGPDGTRTPSYDVIDDIQVQVQALSAKEIEHLSNLNIQGVLRGVYLNGVANGLVRKYGQGGDLLVIAGQTWLATQPLEQWPDWSKIAVTLQLD